MTRASRTALALLGLSWSMVAIAPATDAWAQGAAVDAATDAQKKDAKKKYKKAKKAFDQDKFEEALGGFQESYAVVASPNSNLMIARCLAALGRHLEAYERFQAVAVEADAAAAKVEKYKKTAEAARSELGEVRAKIGLVKVTVSGASAGTKLTVAGKEIPQGDWGKEVPFEPGTITILVTTSAGLEDRREVAVEAGGAATIDIPEPRPAEAPPPPVEDDGNKAELDTDKADNRTLAYVAGGVGVLGLATFGVFGALNNSKFSDLEDQCSNNQCPADLESDADTGRTYQTIANVGLIVGGVGLAAGAVLFLTSDSGSKENSASSTTPVVGVGPGSVMVRGKF